MAIVLDRNFDSGHVTITGARNSGDTYVSDDGLTINVRPPLIFGGGWRWYAVRATGVQGLNPTVKLNVANRYVRAANTNMMLAVWGYDPNGTEWHRFDTVSASGSIYTHRMADGFQFAQDTIYIAAHPLYPFSRYTQRFNSFITHPHVTDPTTGGTPYTVVTTTPRTDVLGRAVPALPVRAFRITDPSATGSKVPVVLQVGNHADERVAAFAGDGAVSRLLSNDPVGVALRQLCVFTVVWGANAPGIYAGYVRSSPQNIEQDHNRDFSTSPTLETTAAIRQFWLSAVPAPRVIIDFHSFPWEGASELWWHSSTFGAHARFLSRLRVHHGTVNAVISNSVGSFREMFFAEAGSALQLAVTPEESIDKGKTVASNIGYGEDVMAALLDVVQSGHVTPLGGGTEPEPEPQVIVSDLRYAPAGTANWVDLPTQTDLAYDWNVVNRPNGSYWVEVRDRDTADDAASEWERLTIPVLHPVVEEPDPPDPPPPGTLLALDGVLYRVIADEPARVPAAARQGEYVRAYSGRMLSRVGGAEGGATAPAGRWPGTIYDLTAAQRAQLRTSLANRRRVVAAGAYVGGGSVLVTGTIEESVARHWKGGVEQVRTRVRLVLDAVEGAD